MTLTTERPSVTYVAVSRALVVVMGATGPVIPKYGEHPEIPLTPGGLALLHRLSDRRGTDQALAVRDSARSAGEARPAMKALVRALEDRGLLTGGGDEAPPPGGDGPMIELPASGPTGQPPDQPWRLRTPLVFDVHPHGFGIYDDGGEVRLRLQPAEVFAAAAFCDPVSTSAAFTRHGRQAGDAALSREDFDRLGSRLAAVGVLTPYDPAERSLSAGELDKRVFSQVVKAQRDLARVAAESLEEHRRVEAERQTRTGITRPRVVPVSFNGHMPPLALGMILAYARAFEGGRLEEQYDFTPVWVMEGPIVDAVAEDPGVFLFSDYLWSHQRCMEVSEKVKRLNPHSVTVHGGPNVPKYEADADEFFRAHPHVDVAVRGEGEVTTAEILAALAGRVGNGPVDLSVLDDVPGLTYRRGDQLVRTGERERLADLDTIPSPYLTGLFDDYARVPYVSVTIETNRGCPYGCTFCDWGSATQSRIRKFDLDRIFAELEWCARNRVKAVGLADANFGIWERDVEIAEKIAELKGRYGYPLAFGTSYAKNTVKHLRRIIEIMVGAGILSHGVLSLQSMDGETLDTIARSNIKLEKYEELLAQFREAELPLYVDLMVGLPGSTVGSFKNDLQACIDREVQVNLHPTELLPNSPMNAPEYRRANDIHIERLGANNRVVVSTASFTRADYRVMGDLRRLFLVCEDFGLLRQVARYVRQETGTREIDFYDLLRTTAHDDRERWPLLSVTVDALPDFMAAPLSWDHWFTEVRAFLIDVVGLADDAALDTVLEVQRAILPSPGRRFPCTIDLAHDYAAWFSALIEAKDAGHRQDWPSIVPRLGDLPAASFTVDDPSGVSDLAAGQHIDLHGFGYTWELASPVARRVDNWTEDLLLDA